MSKKQFILESLKDFSTTGSFLPSQKFLAKSLTKKISKNKPQLILEFGTGIGSITKEIIKNMHPNSRLITFEINHKMVQIIRKRYENHKQITIIEDDVNNLTKYLENQKADIIISSLPLGSMKKSNVNEIINISNLNLKKDGLFVQYQYFALDIFKFKKTFKEMKISVQPLNLPPAMIYTCKKTSF